MQPMIDLNQIKSQFENESGHIQSAEDVEALKNKFLGRKQGLITDAFKELAGLDLEKKKQLGPELNALRTATEQKIQDLSNAFSGKIQDVDITVPPHKPSYGHLHPITQTQKELEDIFTSLGFSVQQGPEIESDWYNFTALNFPEDHPARDMQDTFFIKPESTQQKEKLVLRTQTSNVQIRFMQAHKPPFAMIAPGRVYRNEATDATHEHTFMQMEGLVVGEDVTFAQMMWTLDFSLRKFFGPETKIKILPSYFPFVEPGAEVAISNPKFRDGKWLEILGCGMVHQNVFTAAGYPKNKYQGFAFGFGLTRFALMKYGIPDIRLLSENNLEFLKQF